MRTLLFCLLMLAFTACGSGSIAKTDSGVPDKDNPAREVSPAEAETAVSKAYSQFVDVRTPEEYSSGHAARSVNIPLDTLAANLDRLEKNEPVYLICESGIRSQQAAGILKEAGFNNVLSVKGGTAAWRAADLPMETKPPHSTSANSNKLDEKTQNALIAALQDERRAQATYQSVLNKYAGARPFVNIVEAEKQHQSLLLVLFAKYGVEVPKNEFDPATIAVPDSLTEACRAGVAAEKENIDLYEGFFKFVKEDDIKAVFRRLQSASRDNHLPAFTRCSEGRMGGGPGRGR